MTAPDLTLPEVLERLLPHCDNSVFEVAKWLNDHAERNKIIILGDGKHMHPASVPGMVKVDGFVSPTGEPYLKVQAPYAKIWTIGREGFEKYCPGKAKSKELTLKQEMILAIVQRLWLSQHLLIPTNLARVTREIGEEWGVEYEHRKLHDPKLVAPPDRKTVRRTLQKAR
jgi:hypothetical protein